MITGLTVFYNTPNLIDISIKSFINKYPNYQLIIVDNNSDNECFSLLQKLQKDNKNVTVLRLEKNYGHGPGLNRGMKLIKTPYVLIFDSDLEILSDRLLPNMMEKMTDEVYGIGFTRSTSRGGSQIDVPTKTNIEAIKYLHPVCCLISIEQYKKFRPFHSGGAPFAHAMSDIHDTGKANKMIIDFPIIRPLNNTSSMLVRHHSGSTRAKFGICSKYIGE